MWCRYFTYLSSIPRYWKIEEGGEIPHNYPRLLTLPIRVNQGCRVVERIADADGSGAGSGRGDVDVDVLAGCSSEVPVQHGPGP